uniref:ORF86 n=1 Tax=Malaco herpesvirus 1 TaxID=3031797 RepID=A0AA48P7X9_9VIRU|nr:TPA_asm: ORF86 [Malaco herpesvirus 1]
MVIGNLHYQHQQQAPAPPTQPRVVYIDATTGQEIPAPVPAPQPEIKRVYVSPPGYNQPEPHYIQHHQVAPPQPHYVQQQQPQVIPVQQQHVPAPASVPAQAPAPAPPTAPVPVAAPTPVEEEKKPEEPKPSTSTANYSLEPQVPAYTGKTMANHLLDLVNEF